MFRTRNLLTAAFAAVLALGLTVGDASARGLGGGFHGFSGGTASHSFWGGSRPSAPAYRPSTPSYHGFSRPAAPAARPQTHGFSPGSATAAKPQTHGFSNGGTAKPATMVAGKPIPRSSYDVHMNRTASAAAYNRSTYAAAHSNHTFVSLTHGRHYNSPSDVYRARTVYYSSHHYYVPSYYHYHHNYGMWDSYFLMLMLFNNPAYSYNHWYDPSYQQFLQDQHDAATQVQINQIKAQLASMHGTRDPNYVPPGTDPAAAYAASALVAPPSPPPAPQSAPADNGIGFFGWLVILVLGGGAIYGGYRLLSGRPSGGNRYGR